MKVFIFSLFSFFAFYGSSDYPNDLKDVVKPETIICDHVGGGLFHCTRFLDGNDCKIVIDGDHIETDGPGC